jgi:hypothetical protein
MKAKHMDVACYSILLVAVAIVGIQLTSPGSVSGQEEEESFITSIAQDGQNAQDRTQLTTPASVNGQEEEGSTITPTAQDDQNAQSGPGVFPSIASVDDSAEVPNTADVAGSEEAANGEDVTGKEQAANGEDFENDVDSGLKNGADAANDGTNNQNGGAGGSQNQNGGAGGTNSADGTDLANGGFGANGADGVGRNGADGITEAADGEDGADAFALQLEAVIP